MKSVMFVRGLLAIMLLLTLGALAGCGDNEQTQSKPAAVTKEDVKKEAKEVYDTTKAYTQEQMQAFREETEARLAEENPPENHRRADQLFRGPDGNGQERR